MSEITQTQVTAIAAAQAAAAAAAATAATALADAATAQAAANAAAAAAAAAAADATAALADAAAAQATADEAAAAADHDRSMQGLTEVVLFPPQRFNFSTYTTANIEATFSAWVARTGGGATATFNLRVGGTDNLTAVDGTVVATLTAAGALAGDSDTGASFATPVAATGSVVKICAVTDDAAGVARMVGPTVQFLGVA